MPVCALIGMAGRQAFGSERLAGIAEIEPSVLAPVDGVADLVRQPAGRRFQQTEDGIEFIYAQILVNL